MKATLLRLYPRFSFYRRLSGSQVQSGHEGVNKNFRHPEAELARHTTTLLLSRHEKAAAVCRRDGGVIVAHAHCALRDSIPISQTFTARVFECISIPLGPVSVQQFSGQSAAWSTPARPMHSNRCAISWREYRTSSFFKLFSLSTTQ